MDTMRKKVLWTGGLAACVLAVAIAVRASDSKRPMAVRGTADEDGFILLDDVDVARLEPLPEQFTVRTRYPDGDPRNDSVLAGVPLTCGGESKEVYSSKLGQVLFRPGAGSRVADDLVTELVRPCSLCSFSIRVTGGVDDGDDEFIAEVSLYDGCPDVDADGELIPGTLKLFTGLDDDSGVFHDLTLDFGDRGLCTDGSACVVSQQNCGDGSECVENPLEIPTEIWARIRFNTSTAGIVVGSPPVRGFSADGYDDVFGNCRNYFGGFPTFAHATFYTEVFVPQECETHFLAYLAANPIAPAFLPTSVPGGSPTTRLGDDIELTVSQCTLSAYDVGVKGLSGEFILETDLRWPDINSIVPETVGLFTGRGESGSLEVAHTTIDENVILNINEPDQPIILTWAANRSNTGVPEVGRTQAGFSLPTFFAFNVDPQDPGTWTQYADDQNPATDPLPPGVRGVFYAAIYCRGEAPRGACCFNQPAIPGADINCVDDVPVTSCLGSRWQPNATCQDNNFNPPCGAHACCLPSNSTEDLFYDDCREQCILDTNIISCFPVCDGGSNDGLQCVPLEDGGDPAECPDGFCDKDGLCPGQRTCGLTGCMLAGEFTGRPCDPNNPGGGTSDCMTCSISGEYCRPRCIGGTRDGRACDPADSGTCPGDPAADPPIPSGVCDTHFDCPGSETCSVQGQTCETDDQQCSLRCARWNSGEYEGQNDFDCPNFACFDAVGDCFEPEPFEILCEGRCSVVDTVTCRFNIDCQNVGAGQTCVQTDIDCPLGRSCILPNGVCTGRAGCDNLRCCDEVCSSRPVCCEGSLGETWDDRCANDAANNCSFPPGNDDCFSELPNEGASEFELLDDDTGGVCLPESTSCSAGKLAVNSFATSDFPGDPEVCCNANGVNQRILGTIWYKFRAVHDSARIHTCGTPGDETTVDSVIQVFKANNITPNGNDFDECNSLEVIGCNDDSGCGVTGEQASVCVTGLTPGETYFIMMGSKQGANLGKYSLDIRTPCPSIYLPEPGSKCDTAIGIGAGETLFDLEDASIDCPPETCLPAMTNDLWYSVFTGTICDGPSLLRVQTCGYDLDPLAPNPDTTLAVYSGNECPPTQLVGCNDDATVSPVCTVPVDDGDGLGFRSCASDADCNRGCRILGGPCLSDDDCIGNDTCDTNPLATCQTKEEGEGPSSESDCVVNGDCTRGICDGGVAECDTSTYTELRCPNGDPCTTSAQCGTGACEPECGYLPNSGTARPCVAQEECVPGSCQSECAPASVVEVPAFPNQFFTIRVGGEFGSQPQGTLRIECVFDDCNNNGIPDLLDIANGIEPDCNLNGEPDSCDLDSGLSTDCNCNDVLDECDIDVDSDIDCSTVSGPCNPGPFFCVDSFLCDDDINSNGIPDCCDDDVLPDRCTLCPAIGACCNAGVCTIEEEANCTGLYQGDGSICGVDTCTLGSCCQTDATCVADQLASACGAEGEVFRPGVDCGTACDPVGACCLSGVCLVDTEANCSGVYQGDGTTCGDGSVCTIGSCCQADFTCRDDEVASQCGGAGESFRAGVDCTTACPSCSLADVTEAVWADADGVPANPFDRPGNCAVDARRPFDPAAPAVPEGWDRLVLTFSCDPASIGLGVGDFSITTGGVVPGIQSVDIAGNTATVQLDRPIGPGQWTCIASGADEWCAGFLPADASQDRTSNASDINALINALNLVPGFEKPIYATDMDRSTVPLPSDILRLIDLLNGAGTLDPWLAANLPACPSAP